MIVEVHRNSHILNKSNMIKKDVILFDVLLRPLYFLHTQDNDHYEEITVRLLNYFQNSQTIYFINLYLK